MSDSYVLIVSGVSYMAVGETIGCIDHAKVVTEIENVLHIKFEHRYFMFGLSTKDSGEKLHKLSLFAPAGPQYIVEFPQKRYDDNKLNSSVEDGVGVAITTKIIEYGCGINSENRIYNVVLISDNENLVTAIKCVHNRKFSTITVIPTSFATIGSQLTKYTHSNPANNKVLCLADIMRRCPGSSSDENLSVSVVSPSPLLSDEEVRAIEELSSDGREVSSSKRLRLSQSTGELGLSVNGDATSLTEDDPVLRDSDLELTEHINSLQASQASVTSTSKNDAPRISINRKGNVSFDSSLSHHHAGDMQHSAMDEVGRATKRSHTGHSATHEGKNNVIILSELDRRVLRETTDYLRIQRATQVSRNSHTAIADQSALAGLQCIVLRVAGAGLASVNGDYRCVGVMNRAGCFERRTIDSQGKTCRFTIYKCLLTDPKHRCFVWFLSLTPGSVQPGGQQDINYYFSVAQNSTDKAPSRSWHSMSSSASLVDAAPSVTGRRVGTAEGSGSSLRGVKRKASPANGSGPSSAESVAPNPQLSLSSSGVSTLAWSGLTALFTDMFPSAPSDRVSQDLHLQLGRLANQCNIAIEQAVVVGDVVCGSFKELHFRNRVLSRKREVSLVCIEFVGPGDSHVTACCKVLMRVYAALLQPEIELSVSRTLTKLGETLSTLGVKETDETVCVRAMMAFCDVLARCADIRMPFAPLQHRLQDREGNDNSKHLHAVLEASAVAETPLQMSRAIAPSPPPPAAATALVAQKRTDQPLEKSFATLFQELLLVDADFALITVPPFTRMFETVRSEWQLDDQQTRDVCRTVHTLLSEMKAMNAKKSSERPRGEWEKVRSDYNNHARCVRQLMNVFSYLNEFEVKYFVQRLTAAMNAVTVNIVGPKVYRNELSVLNKFCALLTSWSAS